MAAVEDRARVQSGEPSAGGLDTFPRILLDHVRRHGDKPAMREKDFGIWQSWSWAQCAAEIEGLAHGLAALGFRRGDKLAIIGDNRPRLYWSITAAQCLNGVPVPVYQDAGPGEMQFVLDHSEVRFAFVEDQEQVDKLLAIRDRLPRLEAIIYDDARGMRHYAQPFLHSYDGMQERGREFAARQPNFLAGEIAGGKASDLAVMLYTSGTTGQPKGVMLTYDNVIVVARNTIAREGLSARDEVLAYLPIAWAGDHIFSYAQSYCAGFCVSCPESSATVMIDLRELGPTYFFAPPRIWENILTQVMIRIEDAGWIKRRLFHYFMALARRVGPRILDKHAVPARDRLLYALGNLFIYGPLKNTLGFSRIRLAYTAGEAIGPDLFTFYRSLGINIKQLYAMTEGSIICIQPDGEVKPDTVGTPVPGVELKIAESGEVLYRGAAVFEGYFKNAAATDETKDAEGWLHSGDAGFVGADGHLRIIDRAKDVGRLTDGTLFAPKFIENKLKFFPYIREAIVFGAERDYVAAILNIDAQAVGNWAERNGITWASYQELAGLETVQALIGECVARVNRDLAAEPDLRGSQIRRFLVLHKELDADDGELTRTRKVRRRFIGERYAPLIEALFSDAGDARIESEVSFEDGRKGMLRATLAIRDVVSAA